jgi:hypothetical protein
MQRRRAPGRCRVRAYFSESPRSSSSTTRFELTHCVTHGTHT